MNKDKSVTESINNNEHAKTWIEKIYTEYPVNPMNRKQRCMVFDHNGEQAIVLFSLKPSFSIRGGVEIEWIQSYPRKEGIGKLGMQELQAKAAQDNITLTLWPWDKGEMTQSTLIKIYKKLGFQMINKNGMYWKP